jgi:hypothetical protein
MKRHIRHSTVQPPANACARRGYRAITVRQRAMHVVPTRHGVAMHGGLEPNIIMLYNSFSFQVLDLMYIIEKYFSLK